MPVLDTDCVDEGFLIQLTKQLDGRFVDPIKTIVVQNQRCMTSRVRKSSK
jgi:hypothetical protein